MKNVNILNVNNQFITEGFKNIINKELIINIPLDKEIVDYIIDKVYEMVELNPVIENNSSNSEILNCKIYFIHKEDNIIVVFPDVRMRYPWDENCEEMYKKQI